MNPANVLKCLRDLCHDIDEGRPLRRLVLPLAPLAPLAIGLAAAGPMGCGASSPYDEPEEICGNDLDDDGDGEIDCADSGCAQKPPCAGSRFRRGDANSDGGLNITDGIYVLNFLFLGGPSPSCMEAANANDDATLNITDGIYILNYLFLGGTAPPAPGDAACGPDPVGSASALGCDAYSGC
jgi:hypothetical protein